MYARISEAAASFDHSECSFLVLTLDRCGTYSGRKPWRNQDEAFRDLQRLSQRFFRELRRWFARMGWEQLKREWISVVEAHRSGWPHQNIVVFHRQFAAWLGEQERERRHEGLSNRDSILVCRELQSVVTRAGYGLQSTAEQAKNRDAVASYVVKLAGETDRLAGEVAKLSQSPVNAPLRFRRLRSGVGFLPKRKVKVGYTGTLVRRTRYSGFPVVLGLHQPPIGQEEQASQARSTEESIWVEQMSSAVLARASKRSSVVSLPPVTAWRDGRRLPWLPGRRKESESSNDEIPKGRVRSDFPVSESGGASPPSHARVRS